MSYTETKNQIDEQIAELIQNEKIAYKKLKLSYEDLLNAAARATAYLRIQDQKMNMILAKNADYAAHLISQSILPESEKEILTTKIVSEFRVDIANIRRERNKEVARRGGEGKALKDKDGKQQAKNDVKDWWLKWRSSPGMYKFKADFARAMLDKYTILTNQKVIEDWCRSWEEEMAVCLAE